MTPHPTITKTAKWAGASSCALLAAAWIASAWVMLTWSSTQNYIGLSSGVISIGKNRSAWGGPLQSPGLSIRSNPRAFRWDFGRSTNPDQALWAPAWILPATLLIPTAAAWRLDALARRRARHNHCPTCNYDRRGLPATNPCPECGAPPRPT